MLAESVAGARFGAWLFGVFGGMAIVLAALGLTATVAWWVTQRTREIGVRLALGARPWQVTRMMVAETLGVAALSVAAAMAIVVMIDLHLVRGGVRDLPALVGTPLALLGVAAFASWLPARRASLVNPSVAMRRRE
jgi:ABC-type antimicrobial peptide transport system permease subunit